MKLLICVIFFLSCSQKEVEQKLEPNEIKVDSNITDTVQLPVGKKEENKYQTKGVFLSKNYKKIITATIRTNLGDMMFELYPNRSPIATENFINLSKSGFYNNNIFFRLVQDFIVQTGDKTNTGYGDSGFYFKTETHPDLSHDRAGMLSYANYDKVSNSSQFFITLSAQTQLDDRHPIFGMLLQGRDVLDQINSIEVDEKNKPLKEIKIIDILIKGY